MTFVNRDQILARELSQIYAIQGGHQIFTSKSNFPDVIHTTTTTRARVRAVFLKKVRSNFCKFTRNRRRHRCPLMSLRVMVIFEMVLANRRYCAFENSKYQFGAPWKCFENYTPWIAGLSGINIRNDSLIYFKKKTKYSHIGIVQNVQCANVQLKIFPHKLNVGCFPKYSKSNFLPIG